jgi:hypothetical protein
MLFIFSPHNLIGYLQRVRCTLLPVCALRAFLVPFFASGWLTGAALAANGAALRHRLFTLTSAPHLGHSPCRDKPKECTFFTSLSALISFPQDQHFTVHLTLPFQNGTFSVFQFR